MQVGALIRCYHATQYLPIVLRQFEWVDKIVVMNYRFYNVPESSDNTREICEKFRHKKLIIESGTGYLQHGIFNKGVNMLDDCDAIFIADADEIIFRDDQEEIIKGILDKKGKSSYCRFVDYNKDLYHASPERNYLVPMAVKPCYECFGHIRTLVNQEDKLLFPDILVHHLGLVFTPEVIKWKAGWEYKEENHSQEKLLEDWKIVRKVEPPQRLLDLMKEASLGEAIFNDHR